MVRDAAFHRCDFNYDDATQFLTRASRASSKDIVAGSIPEEDLAFIATHLKGLKRNRPLRGLHIGNFVGLSLAYLTDSMRQIDDESVMLSVDPAIPHRGIDAPHDLVTGLMTRYGLEANWLPVTGFSLERSGVADVLNRKASHTRFSSYNGFSATESLRSLIRMGQKFDFALIDGNHSGPYLRREIKMLFELVRPNGLLFLDDVDENWAGVVKVFENLDSGAFKRVAHENRVGVVRRQASSSGKRNSGKKVGKRKNQNGKDTKA
ncbi:class I SAM-dependent methyltransferase [Pseudophaeobacter arcticus]